MGGMARDGSPDVAAAGEKLVAVWIWEYVLKHTSDVSMVKELSGAIAFPLGVPRLKQMAVVRQLANQVSKDLDVKETLSNLEALERSFEKEPVEDGGAELNDVVLSKRLKTESPEVAKRNVKVTGERSSGHGAREESAWKELKQQVLELKEELEKLLGHPGSVEGNSQHVKGKLSALVNNAWELFGPVFLERTEAAVVNRKYKPQGVPLACPLPLGQDVAGGASDVDVFESANRVRDGNELQTNVSSRNEELERTRRALLENRVEMEKLVKDPLPALLQEPSTATEVKREMREIAEPAVNRSLLEPHPSARAQDWDDDEIDESPSPGSPSASRRVQLPPPRSPRLRSRKPMTGESSSAGSKNRRQRKMWTEQEVAILKREVQKYGKGNWKAILRSHQDVFCGRTEVDMKDKWRNLEKHGVP